MTGTSDEGYESWMDEAGLSDESAHPSDMPTKADTASKRSRAVVDTIPTIHQTASQPNSTHKSKKSKPSATTQAEIQFSHNDTSKAANSNSPTPPVLPAPVVHIPSHVGMMSTQGTSESRQASKKYIVKLFDRMVQETVHDENPRNTFDKCTEQQLCTPQIFQRLAGFLCDTTENNSENGYRTSDKHTVPLCSTALNYLQDLYQVVKSRFQATATPETKNLFLSVNQVLPRYNNESLYVCMHTLSLTHLDIVCVSHTYTFIVNIHTFILIFVHGHIYILMLCTVYLITSTQVTRTACGLNK
jgi:hypothetical protein